MKKLYLYILGTVFAAGIIVFCFFPRSTYSPLEKRELAKFPEFTFEKLFSGDFTKEVSSWFSDSEAYRDQLMLLSMNIDDLKGIVVSEEENITFHASENSLEKEKPEVEKEDDNRTIADYNNEITADENAKIAHAGIIIVGSGPKVRALMAYGGGAQGGVCYADIANKYKQTFGSKVNVYCMAIPIATDFYIPTKAKNRSNPQLPTIRNIYSHLSPDVKAVDVYTELAKHVQEDIYLRTDHHWSPLGGHYAAKKFAEVAKVPFKDLSHYEKRVVHNIVGSMYGYSRDIAVKNAPEDFEYYVPKGVEYTTTYTVYNINKNYQVIGEGKPFQGQFFAKFKDGNGGAYCTFMGGDCKITVVKTSTHNGRRLIILKDSFGNAIPSNLFFSFEEIHVIDFRYFTKNMVSYVNDNKITDILFACNIFNAYSTSTCKKLENFLTQKGGISKPEPAADNAKKDTGKKDSAPAEVAEPAQSEDEAGKQSEESTE
ncbi:MAG: hypothetical protein KBT29_02975 [Prevotellaceae bacterium]|nr:hypothetical protein [Candidatus Minthosoma caballi]